jgi:hypothetical protein
MSGDERNCLIEINNATFKLNKKFRFISVSDAVTKKRRFEITGILFLI